MTPASLICQYNIIHLVIIFNSNSFLISSSLAAISPLHSLYNSILEALICTIQDNTICISIRAKDATAVSVEVSSTNLANT